MNLLTVFSGIGSPEMAGERVYGKDLKLISACEFDKFARKSFLANYDIDVNRFFEDINDMDGKQFAGDVDVAVGGSPCQDFSIAGLKKGLGGHRGQLIWQYYRIIKEVLPPVFVYENVKGMVSDNGGKTLNDFLEVFRTAGYHCHFEVIDTKNYGVPQNRERLFIVGFRDLEQYYRFEFAPKIKLEKCLRDILESSVDEKYYLSEKLLECFQRHSKKHSDLGNGFSFKVSDLSSHSSCLTSKYGQRPTDTFFKEPSLNQIGIIGKGSQGQRIYSQDGVSVTLSACGGGQGAKTGLYSVEDRIRKLTPRECFRLQDFPDTFKFVCSDSQLYKQAGNTISVNVMEMIFRQIEKSKVKNLNSLF